MGQTFSEDALMVAGNILFGKNTCGTLRTAVDRGDTAYFAAAADAVLRVKRNGIGHVREQRDAARKDAGKYRFTLELVVQNLVTVCSPPGGMLLPQNENIRSLLEKTLGRTLSWDTG